MKKKGRYNRKECGIGREIKAQKYHILTMADKVAKVGIKRKSQLFDFSTKSFIEEQQKLNMET